MIETAAVIRETMSGRTAARGPRPDVPVRAVVDALAQGDGAVMLVDQRLTVHFADARAAEILARSGVLTLAEGHLGAAVPAVEARLRWLVAAAVERGPGHVGTVIVPRLGMQRPLVVQVDALRPSPAGRAQRPLVAIRLVDLEVVAAPRPAALREIFALSSAEARLAVLLATGLPLVAAARQLGIAAGTARNHLKRILAKTGTRRQVELVRVLLNVPATSGHAGIS